MRATLILISVIVALLWVGVAQAQETPTPEATPPAGGDVPPPSCCPEFGCDPCQCAGLLPNCDLDPCEFADPLDPTCEVGLTPVSDCSWEYKNFFGTTRSGLPMTLILIGLVMGTVLVNKVVRRWEKKRWDKEA